MRRSDFRLVLSRRRFAFWCGFGLFSLSERLGVAGLDRLAAAAMETSEPAENSEAPAKPAHWTAAENDSWWWYERETLVDGRWKLTGITTPYNKKTGKPVTGKKGYLSEDLVPDDVRLGSKPGGSDKADEGKAGQPDKSRRARHGRPPSKWLRSLYADEIRIWMGPLEVPPAGVSGLTFWTHLTRDHSFEPRKIAGLTVTEQAKLHALAHYGY